MVYACYNILTSKQKGFYEGKHNSGWETKKSCSFSVEHKNTHLTCDVVSSFQFFFRPQWEDIRYGAESWTGTLQEKKIKQLLC